MLLSDFIHQALRLAGDNPEATIELFDRHRGVELHNNPDTDTWDFELFRGDTGIVIEFD